MKISRHQSSNHKLSIRQRFVVLGLVVIFGGLGVYFLQAGKAATVTVDKPLLSLAPATFDMYKGAVVNIAVVVDSGNNRAGDVTTTVTYPGSVKLEAVRDACPTPAFSRPITDAAAGKVTIGCQAANGSTGRATIAVLVFSATSDAATANLDISAGTVISQNRPNTRLQGASKGANLTMLKAGIAKPKQRLSAVDYQLQPLPCATPSGNAPNCMGMTVATKDGQRVTPRAGLGFITVRDLHQIYRLPCAPGGTTIQATCPQPASYGPQTVAVTVSGNYSTGVDGLESDLNLFSQANGLPACTRANGCLKVTNSTGGSALPGVAPNNGWDGEMSMDVETVHGICQTCKIQLLMGSPSTADVVGAVDYIVKQPGIAAVSNSWAYEQEGNFSDFDRFFDHAGTPMVFATGDHGTYPGSYAAYPSYPL